ncbi:MAG: RagB/SusD family nutrient uptake outer membrane protein, partial [Bacteroidales bacterium]
LVMLCAPAGDKPGFKGLLYTPAAPDGDLLRDTEHKQIFAYNNKRNSEIIFAFKSEQDEFSLWDGAFSGSFLPQNAYLSTYYDENGNKWDTKNENMFGLMRMQVQQKHYESTFPEGDKRKQATLKGVFNADGTYAGCFPYKFQGTNLAGKTERAMLDDCPVYRYADALLLMAEAKAFIGESAADEINQIRRRAFGAEYFDANAATLAYPNQPQDKDVNEAILKERLCEFFFEGKRWYDLRRFGNEYVFKYTTADKADARKLLWPIDKGTLTKNTALTQTPGYEIAGSK